MAPLTSTHHDKKRRKTGTYSPSGTPCTRPCPLSDAVRGRPNAPSTPGPLDRGPQDPALDPSVGAARATCAFLWTLGYTGPTPGASATHGPRVRFSVAGLPGASRARAKGDNHVNLSSSTPSLFDAPNDPVSESPSPDEPAPSAQAPRPVAPPPPAVSAATPHTRPGRLSQAWRRHSWRTGCRP